MKERREITTQTLNRKIEPDMFKLNRPLSEEELALLWVKLTFEEKITFLDTDGSDILSESDWEKVLKEDKDSKQLEILRTLIKTKIKAKTNSNA